MRIPVSGVATAVPDATTSTRLLGKEISSGRVFWLKKAWFYKANPTADSVGLYDATQSTTGAPASTTLRYRAQSEYGVGQDEFEFPGSGLKFETGCVIAVDGTATGYTLMGGIGEEE